MTENTFLSSNGKTNIVYYMYEPHEAPKGIVQISHGMNDYIERYEHLIKYLNNLGYVVCGNDDLGHGNTGDQSGVWGSFGAKNGHKFVLQDLHTMTQIAKNKYPNLPYFLLGHSMGSFFARYYAYTYPNELDGLILLGTSGKVVGTGFAIKLLSIMKAFKGEMGRSKFIEGLASNSYFKYIENPTSDKDWVTTNPEELQKYLNDHKTQFVFTISAYKDMLKVLQFVNTNKWAKGLRKDLPIALMAGALDPVGQFGSGVAQVYSLLEKQKVKDIKLILYPGARHELHNELEPTKHEFLNDLGNWLDGRSK